MKLVISASLLSAMVFYSSLLPFLHSFNLYISSTIHKNYMFLLCNGLLVFIARNSGLIGSSGDEQSGRNDRGAQAQAASMVDASSKVEDEEMKKDLIQNEEESEILIKEEEEDDDDDEKEERFNFYEEEEEEIGDLSKEELNKKCEEFIRKMKAGIKFESQQGLVLKL